MIGCIVLAGFAAFVGTRIALRHRGWHHQWGGHRHPHGFGRFDCGGEPGLDDVGPDFTGRGRWGGGAQHILRAVLARIGARPEQETAIRGAVDELRTAAEKLRGEGRRTRQELADALRKPAFDEVLLGELFARHDSSMDELRKALVGALARTHDALDEKQRYRLADLLEAAPRSFRGFGW